jgi:hypothetical protein
MTNNSQIKKLGGIMPPRVRITGLGRLAFTTVLHGCTTLNASTLLHTLSAEHAKELFPLGDSIHFDFTNKDKVVMSAKDRVPALLDDVPILNHEHHLKIGDDKTLDLGKGRVRLQVFDSHFPE